MALAARTSMSLRASSRSTAPRASVSRRSVAVFAQTGQEWLRTQPGSSAPAGYFDPAGLSNGISLSSAKRWRESEITHGRVAMLAALGWATAEKFHPLFDGKITGPAFDHFQKVETIWPQFWEVILLFIGIAEAYRIGVAYNSPGRRNSDSQPDDQIKESHTPGFLGFDPLGLFPKEKVQQMDMRTKELNNGRLAMIAVAGFAAQELRDHKTIWRGFLGTDMFEAPMPALPPY